MGFYDEMQQIATGLLKEFDQGGISYIAVQPASGPADDPGAPVETTYPVVGVARGVKFKYIDNVNIVASDMQTVFAVDPRYVPDMDGFVSIDGTRYKVKSVQPIPPAGVTVAHRVIFGK